MAGLESLAQEIIEEILTLLPLQDIASLARTSKALKVCVTPSIYKNIRLEWRKHVHFCVKQGYDQLDPCPCEGTEQCDHWSHPEWSDNTWARSLQASCLVIRDCSQISAPSLYLLFRTIIAAPDLAGHVRSLYLGGDVPSSVWTTSEQTQLTCQDRSHARALLESGPRLWVDSWLRELDRGTPDAFAGVLLLCLPEIEKLQIGLGFQQPSRSIGILLRNSILFRPLSSKLLPDCNKLKVVEIGLNEEIVAKESKLPISRANEYDQHLPLFYLPSIRKLSIIMPDLSAFQKFTWPAELPNAPSLETLELPFTHLPEDDLGHLLEASPNLKILKYDFWALHTFEDHTRQHEGTIDFAKLEQSLKKVKDTLQVFHLQLAFQGGRPPDWDQSFVKNCVSFSKFSAIRALHLPLIALLGTTSSRYLRDNPHLPYGARKRTPELGQMLPSTLEHLCLNDDEENTWDANWSTLYPDEIAPTGKLSYDDEELMHILAKYLSEHQLFTPRLRTLKLLTYFWLPQGACGDERPEDIFPVVTLPGDIPWRPVVRDKEALEDGLLPLCNAAKIELSVTAVRYRAHKWKNRNYPWRPANFDVFGGLGVE